MKPAKQRQLVRAVAQKFPVSQRRACRLVGIPHSTFYFKGHKRDDSAIRLRLRELALARPRYGYLRLHVLLRREGLIINKKRVLRIYREEDLYVRTSPKRKRRVVTQLRVPPPTPSKLNQVWAMDFVHDQLFDGRKIRCLTLVDKFSRECLEIAVDYRLQSQHVVDVLENVRFERGLPEIISVDNGSEFTSKILDQWAYLKEVKLHFIRPGKPVENGHIESFNGRFRDECLNANVLNSIDHARGVIERWRIDYNNWRPHTSIGNLTPREFARRKMNQLTA